MQVWFLLQLHLLVLMRILTSSSYIHSLIVSEQLIDVKLVLLDLPVLHIIEFGYLWLLFFNLNFLYQVSRIKFLFKALGISPFQKLIKAFWLLITNHEIVHCQPWSLLFFLSIFFLVVCFLPISITEILWVSNFFMLKVLITKAVITGLKIRLFFFFIRCFNDLFLFSILNFFGGVKIFKLEEKV